MAQVQKQKQPEKTTAKPEAVFRFGACSASVWAKDIEGKDGRMFTVRNCSFQKSYKDKDGAWQHTNSIDQGDLPKAILALQAAYEFCVSPKETQGEEDTD